MPEVQEKVTKAIKTGAVVMAIRRHDAGKLPMISRRTENLLGNLANIIVRSNIAAHTFENSSSLPRALAELYTSFSGRKGLFYTFSQGVFETTVILNRSAETVLLSELQHEKHIRSEQELSCITLYLPDENTEIAGYYYYILKKIAWVGINIVEILSTTNEFSIIIGDQDVDRAFSVLNRK